MSTASNWPAPPVDATALASMIPASRSALLVIDIQVDFVSPQGLLGKSGVDMSVLTPALDQVHRLIATARAAHVPIAFARVVTREATDSAALKLLFQRREGSLDGVAICRDDTGGADYYQVSPEPGDIEVSKRLYSCFAGTDFESDLRERGIDTLVVSGFTTDCCVESTVRDAFHRDFNVFVVADACADYAPEEHLDSLRAMAKHCALLVETEAVLAAWQALR